MVHKTTLLAVEEKYLDIREAFQPSGSPSGSFRKPQMGISMGIRVTAEARLTSWPMFRLNRLGIRAISQKSTIRTQGVPRLFRLPMKAGSHPSSTPRIMELQ